MDQTVAALIGAVVGASGAVLAQVVSAIATGRREGRRFAWEQREAADAATRQREAALLDTRRELCVRIVSETRTYFEALNLADRLKREGHHYDRQALIRAHLQFKTESAQLFAEVHIVTPDLIQEVNAAIHPLLTADPEQDLSGPLDEYLTAMEVLFRAMRDALGIVSTRDEVQ